MSLCGCWKLKRSGRSPENPSRNGPLPNGNLPTPNLAAIEEQTDGPPTTSSTITTTLTTTTVKSRPRIWPKRRRKKAAQNEETNKDNNEKMKPNVPTGAIPSMGKVPSKKVSFSWQLSSSQRHDSYAYIDEEAANAEREEDGYSKLEDNQSQHRYDYPTFLASRRRRASASGGAPQEEHLYASASQTYSMGSEDPYSSIISVGDRPPGDESSGIYEPGYSRIGSAHLARKRAEEEAKSELDALYAKINRRPSIPKADDPTQPSTSSAHLEQRHRPTLLNGIGPRVQLQQEAESGSGSVTSGSQPSYRYLTVRESPRTIRERIRRREEGAQLVNGNNENLVAASSEAGRRAEHFYSEINEYESVGGDSLYSGSLNRTGPVSAAEQLAENAQNNRLSLNGISTFSSSTGQQLPQPVPVQTSLSVDTLRILFSPNPGTEPPRPPTSPIPRAQPPQPPPLPALRRPVIVQQNMGPGTSQAAALPPVGPHKKQTATTSSTAEIRSPTKDFHRHVRSVLQPLWHNGSLLIGGKKQQQNHQMELKARAFADGETQTPPVPPSRIPVPIPGRPTGSGLLRRTPSPTQDVAVQTGSTVFSTTRASSSGRTTPKKQQQMMQNGPKAPSLPAQVGKDYVSSIDLSSQRGWPLMNCSMSSSVDEEE